jgi:L,D-peptidoglycan transpeptidase YkuD (ErfK/YbiS/YcfS/YnhG family)
MHILIKNKNLIIGNYKVKCAIGKRGIGTKKKEGDFITPRGKYKIKSILYRNDRIFNLKSKIKKIVIQKTMGWCDDPKSKQYNKLIKFPFDYSAEKLYRSENIYDIILVLNYNLKPIIKNKGSAIFIHVSKNNDYKTAGCVAVNKKSLKRIIKNINTKTIVNIN